MNREKSSKQLKPKVCNSLASTLFFVSILIIDLFFYGLSHSEEPLAGYVMTVKVRMESSTKKQSIEKVIIQPGRYKEKPPKPYDITTSSAPPDLPQLSLLDSQGRVLYMTEFDYPKLMTVPPLPPGERDDTPSVVLIDNPEVTLVLPYFPDATTIQVIAPGETRPSATMPLSDAESEKKNKPDAVPIEPAPSLPGSLNILIMASGYGPLNMTNFQARANSVKQTLQSTEPFKSYASKISINIYGNTAGLGCYTGCTNIDRLMCCDSSKVTSAAASSGYYYDEIIVIHNTATYAGGGSRDLNTYKTNSYSTYCQVYDGPWTTAMALHEFGHSFGNLCDEYAYTTEGYRYYDCVNCRANCTDWNLYSSSCQSGCDAMQTYYRPEDSVMLSLSFMTYNNPSIKAPYSPDGIEKRIQYFTGTPTPEPFASILWRNTSTGENMVWYMNGTTMTSSASLLTVGDQNWKIVGTGDFNKDGKPDIVWRNTATGDNVIWYMDGANLTNWASLYTVTDQTWKIMGTGDFNGDGNTDIVWRNNSTGSNVVWYMNGITLTNWVSLYTVADQTWTIVGTGDFNNDGKPDIILRNTTTGDNVVWYMNGTTLTNWANLLAVPDQHWTIVGIGDFNKDGKPDILWRNTATGDNVVWYMNGVSMTNWVAFPANTDPNWRMVGVE